MVIVQINFRLEEDVRDDFDIWCIKNKTNRTDALVKFMTEKGNIAK